MLFEHPNAMQLRVELDGIEPAVWRRLAVPCNWHLASCTEPSKRHSTGGTTTCTSSASAVYATAIPMSRPRYSVTAGWVSWHWLGTLTFRGGPAAFRARATT